MGDKFTAQEVRNGLRTLRDYLKDLDQPKYDQFGTKLRLFVNYMEMDGLLRHMSRALHDRGVDAKSWYAKVAAGEPPVMPKAGAALLGFAYSTLGEFKRQGIDLRSYVSTVYSTHGGFPEAYATFREGFIVPFQNGVDRLVSAIESGLPADPDGKIDIQETLAARLSDEPAKPAPAPSTIAKSAAAATAVGKPAKPAAPAPAPAAEAKGKETKAKSGIDPATPIESLWKTLEASVKKGKDLVAEVKKDVETDLKIIKLELGKKKPNLGVLLAVVKPLEGMGGAIAEVGAAIRSKLEGAAKK